MTLSPSFLILSTVLTLAAIGLYGLLAKRQLIRLVIALQVLTKAAVLALVAAGVSAGRPGLGQVLGVTVILVDTVVAMVALALAVQIERRLGTLDVGRLTSLRG